MIRRLSLLACLFAGGALALPAIAQTPTRIAGQGAAIADSVSVPAGSRLVYVSGTVPAVVNAEAPAGSVERFGDTYRQTQTVLAAIEQRLIAQGMTMGDVVMMRVFLVAPPGQSRMDFAGMMRAYTERFGTAAQPNRPARSTMAVAGLVDPGWLVEIEVTAAAVPARRR